MTVIGVLCSGRHFSFNYCASVFQQWRCLSTRHSALSSDSGLISPYQGKQHCYGISVNDRNRSLFHLTSIKPPATSNKKALIKGANHTRQTGVISQNSAGCSRKKFYSHSVDICWQESQQYVKIGGQGNVRLDVYKLQPRVSSGVVYQPTLVGDQSGLKFDQPEQSSSSAGSLSIPAKSSEICLYLPRGPFPDYRVSEEDDLKSLLDEILAKEMSNDEIDITSAPRVVKINYSLGLPSEADGPDKDTQFPMAVHEVQCCLDYIWQTEHNLLHTNTPVSIRGTFFGASLALMLALTNPNEVRAVTAINPITDWTALDELVQSESSATEDKQSNNDLADTASQAHSTTKPAKKAARSKQDTYKECYSSAQQQSAACLIDLRTKLFRSPSGFFDPFASPLLFLRAPGKDTPLWKTAKPELDPNIASNDLATFGPYDDDWHVAEHDLLREGSVDEPNFLNEVDIIAESMGTDAFQKDDAASLPVLVANNLKSDAADDLVRVSVSPMEVKSQPRVVKRRKVLRRWPPIGRPEDVNLPTVRILASPPTLVADMDVADRGSTKIDFATILYPQAKEMVEVMQRACFRGREKSLAEETVIFEELPQDNQLVD